jgi:hypothetical protein
MPRGALGGIFLFIAHISFRIVPNTTRAMKNSMASTTDLENAQIRLAGAPHGKLRERSVVAYIPHWTWA